MFTKEIEKIKELTEKLKNEGDVTEDEADWLYIISLFHGSFGRRSTENIKK